MIKLLALAKAPLLLRGRSPEPENTTQVTSTWRRLTSCRIKRHTRFRCHPQHPSEMVAERAGGSPQYTQLSGHARRALALRLLRRVPARWAVHRPGRRRVERRLPRVDSDLDVARTQHAGGIGSSVSVTIIMDTILGFLGIMGVYLARIYREVRHRPSCIVSFSLPPSRRQRHAVTGGVRHLSG